MGIKKFKPTSPGVRSMTVLTNEDLTQKKPERSLGENGEHRYILSPVGLSVGDTVVSGNDADIKPGNALPIRQIPVGTMVHNVELKVGKGGQLARAAGNVVQILAKEGQYAHLRLGSGEVRLVFIDCMATVGQVGNLDHEKVSLGKAGRSRWLGRRPTVRGGGVEPGGPPLR